MIIEALHSLEADQNTLFYLSARNDAQLKEAAASLLPFLTARRDTLAGYVAQAEKDEYHVSEKTKTFWQAKLIATEAFLEVYVQAAQETAALEGDAKIKRQEYFDQATRAWEVGVKAVLLTIAKEMVGPLVLGMCMLCISRNLAIDRIYPGDQISIPDLHLGPWLARVGLFAGAKATDSGVVAIAKIERFIAPNFTLPKDYRYPEAQRTPTAGAEGVPENISKFAAFWDAIKERPSWQKYYGTELH